MTSREKERAAAAADVTRRVRQELMTAAGELEALERLEDDRNRAATVRECSVLLDELRKKLFELQR